MSSIELRRWVTIAGIALILLIIAADTYEAWADYQRVISDNRNLELGLSHAVAEQTARMIQAVDVLQSTFVAASPHLDAASDQRDMRRLIEQMMHLPFIRSASIIDAQGRIAASSMPARIGTDALHEMRLFTVPRDAANNDLYIDEPRSRDGARSFALSRRIAAPDGSFAGVVMARVAFDYLAAFYAQVTITPDTSIVLRRRDGITLAHYPVDLPNDEPTAAAPASEQIEVSQQVMGYPIVVSVSRSRAEVRAPWIQEERSSAARTLSLAVLAAILLTVLRAALDRQAQVDGDKRRLEQELAAIQRVEALGFLAASVAHDFNNVLTAIIGYAELTRETAVEPAAAANLERLLAATERARLLVRRVLTFDPRRSVSYRPTPLEPIILEVSHQVRATLPASIDLRLNLGSAPPSILGDATEIYQVVMNLCSNSVHATASGGSLEVRLETLDVVAPRALALGQLRTGRWVCLSVIDSGVGLEPSQTQSIFEPFYTTRQHAHGTGIGLTVVRNIILRMNGALDVASVLGSGTRMAVYWPAIEQQPWAAPALEALHPERRAGDGAGQTIMVVDDERELVALTEELLASLSYEPVGFSDARVALDAFKQDPQRFDAVLTDERMQPLGGLDFSALVHAIEPTLPILLMTGHRDAEIDARAAAAGIAETLDKPLRVQTLREALARATQLKPVLDSLVRRDPSLE